MDDLSRKRSAVAAGVRNTVIAIAALALVCIGLHRLLPMPEVPQVSEKLAWLSAHRDSYDVLFIGSSRVRRQLSPRIFDERMAARGVPTTSYNFGIDAMTFPELGYVFDRILELKPTRLRLVVADVNPLRRAIDPANDQHSLRAIYWHDLEHTLQVCQALWQEPPRTPPRTQPEIAGLLFTHVEMMLRNYGNLGRGALLWSPPSKPGSSSVVSGDPGYFPVKTALKPAELASYHLKLEEMKGAAVAPAVEDMMSVRAWQSFVEKVERVGARTVLVVSPTVSVRRSPPRPPSASTVTLEFDDPVRYPSLYSPANRYDLQHLNEAGSEEFTGILADQIADRLSTRASAE